MKEFDYCFLLLFVLRFITTIMSFLKYFSEMLIWVLYLYHFYSSPSSCVLPFQIHDLFIFACMYTHRQHTHALFVNVVSWVHLMLNMCICLGLITSKGLAPVENWFSLFRQSLIACSSLSIGRAFWGFLYLYS